MEVRGLRDRTDVRELLVAHGRAWRAAYEGLLPESVIDDVAAEEPSDERIAAHYDRLTALGEDRVLVAADGGGTVRGYVVYRWPGDETRDSVRASEAELKELYVDPDHWGRGFGTALLEAGIARLPDHVSSVALETLAGNDVGAGFYEARGFEPDGVAAVTIDDDRYPTQVYRKPL